MTNLVLTNSLGQFDLAVENLGADPATIRQRIEEVLLSYSAAQKAVAEDYLAGGTYNYGFLSATQAYVNLDGYRLLLEGSVARLTVSKITVTRLSDNAKLVIEGNFVYSGVSEITQVPNGSTITSIEISDAASTASIRMTGSYLDGRITGKVTAVVNEELGSPWNSVNPSGRYAEEVSGDAPFTLTGVATSAPSVSFGSCSFSALRAGTFDESSQSFLDHGSVTGVQAGLDVSVQALIDLTGPDVVRLVGSSGIEIGTQGGQDSVDGSPGPDLIRLEGDNDTVDGGAGNDTLDGGTGVDIARFDSTLAGSTVALSGTGLRVTDGSAGGEGSDLLLQFERLQFTDMGVNLTVQAVASSIPMASLNRICELYVGYFGRVPAANGLENWVNQFKGGKTLDQIAGDFYGIGASEQLREYTRYWDFTLNRELSDADYVKIVYRNVLGREGLQNGIDYWAGQLSGAGAKTRGELVSTMLDAAHGLKTNADWGWVANLLDDRIAMSKKVAIDWGLNYASTDQQAIEKGMAIAGAVDQTPNPNPAYSAIPIKIFDFVAATELVGVNPDHLDLIP